ncbi:MAG: type 11 methyltransferase [Gammaproteobacteria bacterium]|nr:MAG: type 11 methyltransferase [Gammaproteobacteria bacterium]TND02627.1 MAG: type 11 methyltransferase [Gammaproteobacteria bacterium]
MNTTTNDDFIDCWNEILVPKWNRFRHLLSGNGAIHSAIAYKDFGFRPGDKVLDIGCGYGETCLEIGQQVTGTGEVLGIDCTDAFLAVANDECDRAGLRQVRFELADAQTHALPPEYFDAAFSRFGVMFFQSAVMAMRNSHKALKPGGTLCLIVWRTIRDNPCWGAAKEIALKYLPPPGDAARTCGPGPFSWADEETDRAMLKAAGFTNIELFKRIDADVRMGTTVEEAVDYQVLVGPSGEIIREAGAEGQRKLPVIREEMAAFMRRNVRADGTVWLPSSTWAIMARK